ncbi:MAG TPA: MotA/TolQ/ExbB proton channel family protein [Thiotrichales bacterium]|nr:MotA/TolQ/ExbB proton channel family protein [Thiotrichales bacterium]
MRKLILTLLLSGLLAPFVAGAADGTPPASLDELLQLVRKARVEEDRVNRERERRFLADKNRQKQLLKEAKAQLRAETRRSERLKNTFDANEKKLTELEETLRQRMGSLGELFGVVRQVAGDAKATFDNSLVSAQFPDRQSLLMPLIKSKELPDIPRLEDLWFALQQEMTESGKIVKFDSRVILPDGSEKQTRVTRVGVFNVVADGRYLRYLPETGELLELPRQPAGRYLKLANGLESASPGSIVPMAIDPSRGSILALLVQAPDLKERIQQGKLVGYVIIVLFAIGLLIVAVRWIALTVTGLKMRKQLKLDEPKENNPLGRVLAVYRANPNVDTETLELKIDEAVIREVPKLQSGLATIKILAAIAPLLGLLGTVTGMIETFQSITLFGTGDPKLMAGGISQALVTTVLGLVSAIPLVALHSVVAGKSKRLISILDEQSAGIIAQHAEKDRTNATAG